MAVLRGCILLTVAIIGCLFGTVSGNIRTLLLPSPFAVPVEDEDDEPDLPFFPIGANESNDGGGIEEIFPLLLVAAILPFITGLLFRTTTTTTTTATATATSSSTATTVSSTTTVRPGK